MRRTMTAFAAVAALAMAMPAGAADYSWKPDKPITIIVPWSAGGSTDQVTRVVAGELTDALGQNVVVVNQPGASGSIGTKNALEAPKDGYTWAAGAASDVGTYVVLGMLDTKIADGHLILAVAVLGFSLTKRLKNVEKAAEQGLYDPSTTKTRPARGLAAARQVREQDGDVEDERPTTT